MNIFKKRISNFQKDALEAHNRYRAQHRSKPLKWSDELAQNAEVWARKLAKFKILEHEDLPDEGENITYSTVKKPDGKTTTDVWYNESQGYQYNTSEVNLDTSHFTQIVWASSEEFGIATYPGDKDWYIVARYSPPGNIQGKFRENVFPPLEKISELIGEKIETDYEVKREENYLSKLMCDDRHPDFKEEISEDKNYLMYFSSEMIIIHNQIRAAHGAMPLILKDKLNFKAQKLAQELLMHKLSKGPEPEFPGVHIGKSISFILGAELPHPRSICISWYEGRQYYDYRDGKFNFKNGGFTQLVWKNSKYVGFGVYWGENRSVVVALYSPAGNVSGLYFENVKPVELIEEVKIV